MADKYTNINSDIAGFDNLSKFDGFYNNRYFDPLVSGYGFIFITKPQLFIAPNNSSGNIDAAYNNMTRDPYFVQFIDNESFNDSDKYLARLLSYKKYNNVGTFLPMFTNKLKNIETNDVSLETTEVFETKQGYRMPMPTFTTQSESSSQLTLSVTESSNMDFTKLISMWVKYISNITDGTFDANPDMIRDGVLDYTSSIYYFALEPDGRTIKYWCKYTGCWPTTIPYSAMRYNKGDIQTVELDLPFIYTVKEDMSPSILEDFNIVSLKLTDSILPVLSKDNDNLPYSRVSAENPYLDKKQLLKKIPDLENMQISPYVVVDELIDPATSSVIKKRYVLTFNNDTNTNEFYKNVFKDVDNTSNDAVDSYYFSIDGDDSFFKL